MKYLSTQRGHGTFGFIVAIFCGLLAISLGGGGLLIWAACTVKHKWLAWVYGIVGMILIWFGLWFLLGAL